MKNVRNRGNGKNFLIVLLCFVLMIGVAACNNDSGNGSGDDPDDGRKSTYAVELYYANEAYIVTGDESLGHLVGPMAYEMEVDDPDERYRMLVDSSLRMGADAQWEDSENALTMITDAVQFGEVREENGTAYVDIRSKGADGEALAGGSLEEMLLLEQITHSLIDSFEAVEQVQFLVDGKEAETLMGHMDLTEPFGKDSFRENGL